MDRDGTADRSRPNGRQPSPLEIPHPPTPVPDAGERGSKGRIVRSGAASVALLALAACGPEGERSRGGGAGADIGNRGSPVVLLEETYDGRVFYETPNDLPAVSGPAGAIPTLEPATPLPPSLATPVGATPGPAPFGSPTAVPDAATPVGATPVVPPATTGGTTDATPVAAPFAAPFASPVT